MSYENELKIADIINNEFRPKTVKARDATRTSAAEMKYKRKTAGYTWTDDKTNTDIAKELNITPVTN
jgi:hypothetical protein